MLCYCEDLDANSKDSLIGPPKLTGRIAKNGGVKVRRLNEPHFSICLIVL